MSEEKKKPRDFHESLADWPMSSGKTAMDKWLKGEPISRVTAMSAKCADCCNGYKDGRHDCKVPDCPLYPWMPYAEDK